MAEAIQANERPSLLALISIPLVIGVFGAVATLIAWGALALALWLPFWKQLRNMGMYTHDISTGFLVYFGPIAVGLMFWIAAILAVGTSWIMGFERNRAVIVKVIMLIPGILVFVLLNSNLNGMWHYPMAEGAVLLVGYASGKLLILLETSDLMRRPASGL